MNTLGQKRKMVGREHPELSLVRQCGILGIHRSGIYYEPRGESELNLELLRLMGEHYLAHPYKGAERMHTRLTMDMGKEVSRNRVNRLYYNILGFRSILPSPSTSKPGKGKGHRIYPYLLRGLDIVRPNQVWTTDITYIPMNGGFLYLVAIIDSYSRFVVGWSVSNTMDAEWCGSVLKGAVEEYGNPEILNSDQGSQFTSNTFTESVADFGIRMSMDGKGRCIDNVFIERLWWSVKYEDVYIREYRNGWELEDGLVAYFDKYNYHRRHQSLNNEHPADRFFSFKPSHKSDNEEHLKEKNLIFSNLNQA